MYCPNCGTQMPEGALGCTDCGWRETVAQPQRIGDDPAMRMLLPLLAVAGAAAGGGGGF